MTRQSSNIGDDVNPDGGVRGVVVDYRALPARMFAVGVMSTNGLIEYHAESSVASSEGMGGYPMKLH